RSRETAPLCRRSTRLPPTPPGRARLFRSRRADKPPAAVAAPNGASSCPITRVDAYVALGEVARPESRRPFALSADVDRDLALRGVEHLFQFRLRKIGRQPAAANQHMLHANVRLRGVEY